MKLRDAIGRKVLVLDGSMGVMIQKLKLTEAQFRGERFKNHPNPLSGNNDILVLGNPQYIADIHRSYLEAGADIIETDTFNATTLSQAEYGTDHLVDEINLEAARMARRLADEFTALDPGKPRFVAGAIGPTAHSASLSHDVNDTASRSVDFDTLAKAFGRQASALIKGGVDALIIETIFDALNARAAIAGVRNAIAASGRDVEIILSITISDTSGRLLSGHTPDAFLAIAAHARPLAIGFNCSAGPATLLPHLRRLAEQSPFPTIFYPNAGLPDESGRYSESPHSFAATIEIALANGLINIAGGCCGTTPEHIKAVADAVGRHPSPRIPSTSAPAWLAGLEPFRPSSRFINVGERCNVAGSRKFLRLIKEKSYAEAVEIARKQVADGAMILDINLDDGMLDTISEMRHFLRLLASEPDTAAVPWMIDSSDFAVVEEALKNAPGKIIVNSISLKHGQEDFLDKAKKILAAGAAVVVMAFDENGQATTFERKIEICSRAYRLLTSLGMPATDIIFDPNVLTIATGMPEHDRYGLEFIRAVRWISHNLPGARTSGGVSNLSFAFRGNNYLRQAMHAVFLYHAIQAGLSMAIMDPGAKVTYSDIPPRLLRLLEDAILCSDADAAGRLVEASAEFTATPDNEPARHSSQPTPTTPEQRLQRALLTGNDSGIGQDVEQAMEHFQTAGQLIDGPLMQALEQVGKLFEEGKLFLPQVVKSARVMRRIVDALNPWLSVEATAASSKGTFLIATVKGDVHDIGKNIAAVVLRCNGYKVIDLGVQVDAAAIVEAAKEHHPDFIGLSGLISPSLGEMATTALALRDAGISVPLFVGGAATSPLHTALHIAPCYDGCVVRVADASQNPVIASKLSANPNEEADKINRMHRQLRDSLSTVSDISSDSRPKIRINWTDKTITPPSFLGQKNITGIAIADIRPFINWVYFLNCWKIRPNTRQTDELLTEANHILDQLSASGATMDCAIAFHPAYSQGDAIATDRCTIQTPRQKPSPARTHCLALSDFVAPPGYGDHIGCFIVTIGPTLRQLIEEARQQPDDYRLLMLQSVADRLTEATSEWLHYQVRTRLWGYAPHEPMDLSAIRCGKYSGIRPAVGYPSLPDQKLMHSLFQLIDGEPIGVHVTINGALVPASSVAGLYISSPHSRYFSI